MRNHRKDILIRVKLGHLVNSAFRLFGIGVERLLAGIGDEERFAAGFGGVDGFEDRAWARRNAVVARCVERVWMDLVREREVLRWSELAAVVSDVATEEHEGGRVGGSAGEGAHVAFRVARGGEEVEAAVGVKVDGAVFAKVQAVGFLLEVDFAEVAVRPGALVDWAVLFGWVGWGEVFFEAWADD